MEGGDPGRKSSLSMGLVFMGADKEIQQENGRTNKGIRQRGHQGDLPVAGHRAAAVGRTHRQWRSEDLELWWSIV